MIEQLVSVLSAGVVFIAVLLRLNLLKADRKATDAWRVLEVCGLVLLLGGCIGSAGEWFMVNEELRAETLVLCGAALFGIGVSKGALCQLVARLNGWDGADRRARPRP